MYVCTCGGVIPNQKSPMQGDSEIQFEIPANDGFEIDSRLHNFFYCSLHMASALKD